MPLGGRFHFGDYVLDTGTKQLLRDGIPVPLPPGQFEVLARLVVNAGEVVPTAELESAFRVAENALPLSFPDYASFNPIGGLIGALFPVIDDNPASYIPGLTADDKKELERRIAALKADGSTSE